MGSTPLQMVDFEEALAIVRHDARPGQNLRIEVVELAGALGRVLARDIVADRDQPPFNRATRDGFAVRAADVAGGQALSVSGQLRAGEVWAGSPVATGTAVEIMTGASVPEGSDAVVMVEHTRRVGATLEIAADHRPGAGENIVPRGTEARRGQTVVAAGTRIGAAEIAMAATCGCAALEVFSRPTVAIISTGDELVEVVQAPNVQAPNEGQIRNSNSYAIAAMVTAAGAEPRRLAIARDTREDVAARVAEARLCDLVVFSGGVSMGEYDLVEEVLEASGARFLFTGVRMQPGKPVVFGRLPECGFFGLPGNPISTQVTFLCFVAIYLRALGGETAPEPRFALARLQEAISAKPGLTRLLPARLEGVGVRLLGWQGSGDLAANARASCYAELLPGQAYIAGDVLRVLLR